MTANLYQPINGEIVEVIDESPTIKSFVIELANGVLPGYAATTRAYSAGGYETGASLLTGQSGEQLVEAAVELLQETV